MGNSPRQSRGQRIGSECDRCHRSERVLEVPTLVPEYFPSFANPDTELFATSTVTHDAPLDRATLTHFAVGLGEGVFRVKGLVWLAEDPDRRYVYQQVGKRWTLQPGTPWNAQPRCSHLVVIGRPGESPEG